MGEQIRTWDQRAIDETGTLMLDQKLVLRLDETSTVDRLELILQLREVQESDRYALNYAI